MTRSARIAMALATSLLSILIAPPVAAAEGGPDQPAPLALRGLDPVSLVAGHEVAGSAAISRTRDGLRYQFETEGHRDQFDAQPGRFAAQGTKCAVMPEVPARPDLFLVHDGKVYLFGSPRCRDRFRADPASFTAPRRKVAVLIFDGVDLLDVAGPIEVFSHAGGFEVFTVAATAQPVRSASETTLTPRYTLADSPRAAVVVIPGGTLRAPLADPATAEWVKRASGESEVTLSVCTGALLLARSGLLDGLEATTHHQSIAALREAAPRATVREGRRFVDNGRIITSGGVSSGIDAALHVVARLRGAGPATDTARLIEYTPTPAAP